MTASSLTITQVADSYDEYLPVDEGGIPHDGLKSVAGTSFDFRSAKNRVASEFLADDDQRKVKGYDHAFLLQAKGDGAARRRMSGQQMKIAAEGLHHRSGSAIYLDFLGGTPSRGTGLRRLARLALESSFLPDSTLNGRGRLLPASWRVEYSSLISHQFIAEKIQPRNSFILILFQTTSKHRHICNQYS